MKFLVDAQLPRRVAAWLTSRGHDAVHTLELPRRNLTSDAKAAAAECRAEYNACYDEQVHFALTSTKPTTFTSKPPRTT